MDIIKFVTQIAGKKAWSPLIPLSDVSPTAWFKSDAGLYTDAAKTTPAVNDDSLIYTWDNQATGDGDLIQATEAKRPLLKTVNGKKYIRLDGSDDFMKCITTAARNIMTIFIVAKKNSAPITTGQFLFSFPSNNAGVYSKSTDAGVGFAWYEPLADLGGNCENLSVVCLKFNGVDSLSTYVDNGTVVTTNPNDEFDDTAYWIIGARYGGSSLWGDWDIAEILYYPSALSDADRLKVKAYLQARWTNPT